MYFVWEKINKKMPFILIKKEDFNIIWRVYKETYIKNSKEDALWIKIKYNIIIYPKALFILFDIKIW